MKENMTTPNQELLNEIQSFVSTKKTFHIDAFDMEEITQLVYGKSIEMLESANDTTHEFSVSANSAYHDKETLKKAVEEGSLEYYQYGTILDDLCSKGYLEAGEYFLRMSW